MLYDAVCCDWLVSSLPEFSCDWLLFWSSYLNLLSLVAVLVYLSVTAVIGSQSDSPESAEERAEAGATSAACRRSVLCHG